MPPQRKSGDSQRKPQEPGIEIYALMQPAAMTTDDLLAAIDLHRPDGCSVWDALILKAAQNAECVQFFTEDLQHGRRIGGLEIVNPLLGIS